MLQVGSFIYATLFKTVIIKYLFSFSLLKISNPDIAWGKLLNLFSIVFKNDLIICTFQDTMHSSYLWLIKILTTKSIEILNLILFFSSLQCLPSFFLFDSISFSSGPFYRKHTSADPYLSAIRKISWLGEILMLI